METSHGKFTLSMILYRVIRVVVVLAIAVLLACWLIFTKKEPEKNEVTRTPPAVKIMIVKPVSKMMTVDAFGTVKPRKSVKIAVEVPGRIVFLHPSFIEGGEIQKGELLVRIDPESYQLEKSAAQVRVSQARTDIENFNQEILNLKKDIALSKANLMLAKKELDRVSALTQNKYASKNSQERMEQQYLQAKMKLQSLENRLQLTDTIMKTKRAALSMAGVDFQKADLALKRTQIKAEFNGFVLEKIAESGEYVSPGQILGVIYQKGKLDVDVRIPLEKTVWLNEFAGAALLPEVSIRPAGGMSGKHWKGQVARLMARIDEQTRTLPLTIEIIPDNEAVSSLYSLKPGTFVKCRIMGKKVDRVFVLPRYLLKQKDLLYTVDAQHLKMKKVSILRKFEDEIYIDDGLKAGDQIIVSPLPGALDGMELSILGHENK